MRVEEWMRIYREIEHDFSYPREREMQARDILSAIIGNNFVRAEELHRIIPRKVYVVGFAPNLERSIPHIPGDAFVIAADESSIILKDYGITPRIIITDLDGDVKEYGKMDAIIGVHAHGDNINLLPLAAKFKRRFGTTQIEPLWNVYNFGGFTDGDRAVFLAHHFGAREIHLVGFDFRAPREKKGKNMEMKRRKLIWAERLINHLIEMGARIVFDGR